MIPTTSILSTIAPGAPSPTRIDRARVILTVDDEPGFRLLVSDTLREGGYKVFTAASGNEALAWLKENEADLILLDMGLPDIDGAEVTRRLRAEARQTPFIVVSGCEDGKKIVEMMRQGAQDYLIKNGTLIDLLPRVVARTFVTLDRQRDLAEAQRRIRESEARLNSALTATQDGIWEWNIADDTLYVSPRWKEIFGYLPDEVSTRAQWEARIHPEDRSRFFDHLHECLASSRNRIRIEYRLRDREGHHRWVLSHGLIERDASGKALRIVGASSDQTERLEMEMQLRQMQKMEAIGKLAGGVAHDFNNILATIQGHLWILEKGDSDEHADSLNEISLATQRAASLTRQLLLFSRKQVMQRRDLDLNVLIADMGKMLARSLGEDVRLLLALSPEPAFLHADSGMIEQILLNLAINSRDAMPDGGKITFSTRQVTFGPDSASEGPDRTPGSYICLEAVDTGCGMSEEVCSRVFEPFFTTKEMGKGTGLGLATVHGIVKQHHGWIEVSSIVGEGTTFRIYFPLCREAARPLVGLEGGAKHEAGGRETIFLVEDDVAVRAPLRAFLSHLGYQIVEAGSGAEAISLYDSMHPRIDLLLTDMIMPGGINGKDLAGLMTARIPGLKTIFTSGYDMDLLTPEMALKEGFNFLQKPVPPRLMAATIRKLLDLAPAAGGPQAAREGRREEPAPAMATAAPTASLRESRQSPSGWPVPLSPSLRTP